MVVLAALPLNWLFACFPFQIKKGVRLLARDVGTVVEGLFRGPKGSLFPRVP